MGLLLVNMIPFAHSGETHQDSEPNLAVDPSNPDRIAASAFTPDPLGGPNAPIYVSGDGGRTWALNSIVPSDLGSTPGDMTLRFATTSGVLYAGILRRPGALRLNILRTDRFLGASTMTVLVDRSGLGIDQPWVQAVTAGAVDRVYVGSNDFNAESGQTATIDHSHDASAPAPAFQSVRIEKRVTAGQDGPPIRPAIHADGTVYAVYYGWRAFNGTEITADVVVVRDDNWGTAPAPFSSLADPSDGRPGRLVVTARTVPWSNTPAFGQERLVGSNISIAVDPRNSSVVYVAWADRTGTSDYTLHVRKSSDRGATWSTVDLRTIVNATNPALAVNSRGVVGFLYQQLTGAGTAQRWQTHFERTADDWATPSADLVLADVPARTPTAIFLPYIGDYVHVMAVGKDFYGIFSANNTPDRANFPNGVEYQRNADFGTRTLRDVAGTATVAPSIDPFFFRASQLAADQDFYVRKWTSALAADRGLEPCSDPLCFVTPDVWNRRANDAGPLNAADPPLHEQPVTGTNFVFARIHRNQAGAPADAALRFLYADLGAGNNFLEAGSGPDTPLSFAASESALTPGAGRGWTLPAASSTHVSLAVELSSANDPAAGPSLLGRTPASAPAGDVALAFDNNRAMRAMAVYPAAGTGVLTFYAIAHNAALTRRTMTLRVVTEVDGVDVAIPGGNGSFLNNMVSLPAMEPCENRWIELRMPIPDLVSGPPFPVYFPEEAGGVTVNGFGIALQPTSSALAFEESFRLQASVFARASLLFQLPAAAAEAQAVTALLTQPVTSVRAVVFLRERGAAIADTAAQLVPLLRDNLFGVEPAAATFKSANGRGHVKSTLPAHINLMHKLDAALTLWQKSRGDAADVLQCARWQAALLQAPRFNAMTAASSLRKSSEKFIAAYALKQAGPADYLKLLRSQMAGWQQIAIALNDVKVVEAMMAMESKLGAVEGAQAAHRSLLLAVSALVG